MQKWSAAEVINKARCQGWKRQKKASQTLAAGANAALLPATTHLFLTLSGIIPGMDTRPTTFIPLIAGINAACTLLTWVKRGGPAHMCDETSSEWLKSATKASYI